MTPSPDVPDPEALRRPASRSPASRSPASRSPVTRWIKRFGVAGFLFFLGKGLLWLALPTLIVALGKGC